MRRTRVKIIIGLGLTLVLLLLAALVWNGIERAALRRYRAELATQAERLGIAELAPATVKSEANAAPGLMQGAVQLAAGPNSSPSVLGNLLRLDSSSQAEVLWRQNDLRTTYFTNTWATLEKERLGQAQIFDQIGKALKLAHLNFELRYADGINLQASHLAQEKNVALWLALGAIEALHATNCAEASRNLSDLLTLIQLTKDEPLGITQMVRQGLALTAAGVTWEALQASGWEDAQLATLQRQWQELAFIEPVIRATEMERAMGVQMFEKFRNSNVSLRTLLGSGRGGFARSPANFSDYIEQLAQNTVESLNSLLRDDIWRWHWSLRDELFFQRHMQGNLEAMRSAPAQKSKLQFNATLKAIHDRYPANSAYIQRRLLLSEGFLVGNYLPAQRTFRAETVRELVVTAIALRRYQMRHHQPAPDLAALVPEFLPALPVDYMDGKPLRYHLKSDGNFLLYSVGDNGVDDGGTLGPLSKRQTYRSPWDALDMVWPQAAKEGK